VHGESSCLSALSNQCDADVTIITATERRKADFSCHHGSLNKVSMAEGTSEGILAFVLIGALVATVWLEFRNGKRSSKKKAKPESTVI
jgi:hypothetical protein